MYLLDDILNKIDKKLDLVLIQKKYILENILMKEVLVKWDSLFSGNFEPYLF
jgi:hypothetical protein